MSNSNIPAEQRKKSFRERLGEYVTPQGLVGSLVFVAALGGVAWLIYAVFHHLSAGWGLPILALSSVLLLLGALLVFTTLIHLINLSDPKSALGLPDGSVRALLALALLGLFAILASEVLVTPPSYQLNHIPAESLSAMISAAPDLTWAPEQNSNSKTPMFKATLQTPAKSPDEFGKQMLTLVGTLMTAVISFYFGSATGASPPGQPAAPAPVGQRAGTGPAGPVAGNPVAVSPTTARTATAQTYKIAGTGLGGVTKVEALPPGGGSPVAATNVKALDAEVAFDLSLPAAGAWTIQITSGAAAPVAVPGAIDVAGA